MDEAEDKCPAGAVFDRGEALDRAFGSPELLQELLALFATEGPRLLAELQTAVAAGRAADARRLAHTLKGSAGAIAGRAVANAALGVETAARDGDLSAAAAALPALAQQLDRLLRVLNSGGAI